MLASYHEFPHDIQELEYDLILPVTFRLLIRCSTQHNLEMEGKLVFILLTQK